MNALPWKLATFTSLAAVTVLALRGSPPSAPVATADAPPEAEAMSVRAPRAIRARATATHRAAATNVARAIAQLDRARTNDAMCTALRRVAATGAPEVIPRLLDVAQTDHRHDVRECAIDGLEDFEAPEALDALVSLASDDDREVRQYALDTIADEDDDDARHALLRLAGRGDDAMQLDVASALARAHAPEGVSMLAQAATNARGTDLSRALAALGESGEPAAFDALRQFATGPVGTVRAEALRALGHLGGPQAIGVLEQVFQHGSDDEISAAAEGLSSSGDPRARAMLIEASQRPGRQGSSALGVLANLDGDDVHDVMMSHLDRGDQMSMVSAHAYIVSHHDVSAIPTLLDIARRHAQGSVEAVETLANLGDPSAREGLLAIARSGRGADDAIRALAQIPGGNDELRAVAVDQLEHHPEVVGTGAIEALAHDPSTDAQAALERLARGSASAATLAIDALADRADSASRTALVALAEQNGNNQVTALQALVRTMPEGAEAVFTRVANASDPSTRATAFDGLASCDSDAARSRVIDAVRSSDPDVRADALRAITEHQLELPFESYEGLLSDSDTATVTLAAEQIVQLDPTRAAELATRDSTASNATERLAAIGLSDALDSDAQLALLHRAATDSDENVRTEAIGRLVVLTGQSSEQASGTDTADDETE